MQIEKFHDCLEMLGDVLYLHHHGNLSASTPSSELSQHRVAFIGLAVFITDLLQIVVPVQRVSRDLATLDNTRQWYILVTANVWNAQ